MVGMDDIFDHGEGSFSGRFKIFFVLVNYFSRFTKVYFFWLSCTFAGVALVQPLSKNRDQYWF